MMTETTAPTYSAAKALRLIKAKAIQGEYHVTGSLDLRGCDLKGITLPQTVGGWLDLRGCDLEGITLPQTVGGWLVLSRCDLEGITLPQTVGGSLFLSGCDLKGITLPQTVGGSLVLRGCKNLQTPSEWFTEGGEATRRRVIANDGNYVLIEYENGKFRAGCRGPWTRAQCLKHWGKRIDNRAVLFTAAIEQCSRGRD